MSKAIKRYLKCADWLGRPKWMTDPDSRVNDEDTINDLYETAFTSPEKSLRMKALGILNDQDHWQALDSQARFNQYRARHTTASDALLNRAKGLYDDEAFRVLQKADRYNSLAKVLGDIGEQAPQNALIGKTLQFTPFGKKMRALRSDISDYLFAPDSVHETEVTTPEIARRYQPTPYQLKRWLDLEATDVNREARKSALKWALGGGLAGGLMGLGVGAGVSSGDLGHAGRFALLNAIIGAGVGGTAGYVSRHKDLSARKEWAKSHLNDAREWM